MKIGVDVGGTHTDAVLMEGKSVTGWSKSETSSDISSGIFEAVACLLDKTNLNPGKVENVMVGTTQFVNSLIENKNLLEVAVLRLGSPSGHSIHPRLGWPEPLAKSVGEHTFLLPGGYEFDGREVSSFDDGQVLKAAKEIASRGLKTAAISSTFAVLNADMEKRAAAILLDENPDLAITLSSEIGRLGLYERENATILNASLSQISSQVVQSFHQALRGLGILAPLYISQNDGTLMQSDFAKKFPILTAASGPTNSIRGAAFLSGVKEAIVMDIGGTTCDVGVLQHGFPRQTSTDVNIADVRTNFRMPDILSVGLGGGSIIRNAQPFLPQDTFEPPSIMIGPESVGAELTKKALVFGGDVLTATDVAVATDPDINIGDGQRVRHIPSRVKAAVENKIHRMSEAAIDRIKASADELPVILVGGGHILIKHPLTGCSELIRPDYAFVANAIGAAIAQVGGEVDRVYSYEKSGRDKALADAKKRAGDKVIRAGGDKDALHYIDIDETALSYLPGEAVRVRVKAVSDLAPRVHH